MQKPKVVIRVSYPINLYIHLEVAYGSVRMYYSSKYEKYVKSIIPRSLKESFLKLAPDEELSSLILKGIFCDFSTFRGFSSKIREFQEALLTVLNEANRLYRPFWIKEARPKLLDYKDQLEQKLSLLDRVPSKIAEITGKPWRISKIIIFPVYAYSAEFGYGGQPIGRNKLTIGLADLGFSLIAITHEMAHLNIGKTIINMAKNFNYEPDIINEVIANLITETFIKKSWLTLPTENKIPKGPETEEYKKFQDKFEKYTNAFRKHWYNFLNNREKYPTLERFVTEILSHKLK